MNIEEALEHAASNESILFLGAGFSLGAINVKGKDIRDGKSLEEYLCKRSGVTVENSLEYAAEAFKEKYGTDELINEIKKEYQVNEVTDTHKTIASLPWKRIYTTNYDNVFEMAVSKVNRIVTTVDTDSNIYLTSKKDILCIHLNGFIDRLDRSTIGNSFKLTETAYLTASLENSEWAVLLRDDLRFAKSIFFIGYSLSDLDIKRILYQSKDLVQKTFFIVPQSINKRLESIISKFGNISQISSEGLAEKIKKGGFLHYKKKSKLEIGRSVIEHKITSSLIKSPTDNEFLDLMMLGKFNSSLLCSDSSEINLYNCQREVLQEIADRIDHGSAQASLLMSELANGKTIATEILASIMIQKGWRVFFAKEVSEDAEKELKKVAELSGKILLLIDNYVDWLDFIGRLASICTDQFAIVVTARTNLHDIFEDKLREKLSPFSINEFNLDKLKPEEIHWWINTLDNYGLWGEKAGLSYNAKERYLSNQCDCQIHGFLIDLLKSPNIKDKLFNAAKEIKVHSLVEEISITIFSIVVLNKPITTDKINDIYGVNIFNHEDIKKNDGLANFIDISRYTINVRSSIIARYLLNTFWDANEVANILMRLAEKIYKLGRVSHFYHSLFRELTRFASIQSILPEKGFKKAIVPYYERIKSIGTCKNDPLFWLQYAIATLVINDLERSKLYFTTAYSLAEKKDNFDTYQIDNHYARYLLKCASDSSDSLEKAFNLFRRARTLINRQINKHSNRHYPYRVASAYQQFFDRFASRFSKDQTQEIEEAAKIVNSRIQELTASFASNSAVKCCQEAMDYIITATEKLLRSLK